MTEVIMPKMGDGMEEGTLVEWLKKDGDSVKSGEVIGTIQTDKATLELEAPASGALAGLLIKDGDTVPVGRPIAAILAKGETLPGGWAGGQSQSAATPSANGSSENVVEVTPAHEAATTTAAPSGSAERIKASPLAKKIAQEKGIDLATVTGSGPGGRIVERDLEGKAVKPAVASPVVSAPLTTPNGSDSIAALSRLKKITGERTLQSKLQAPHFYVTVEVDLENILALRAMFEKEGAHKPSINDFVIKAVAMSLRQMPEANSTFQKDGILIHGAVNIGIAVAIDEGLTVPVLKNADQLSLGQISAGAKDLASKAKQNKLGLDELSGSTFSISNMGMLDVDQFSAIVNLPNSGILAVGSGRKKAVVDSNDQIVVRTRMNLTGSFDHRVLDGAGGAKFVNLVRAYLENPTRLLI